NLNAGNYCVVYSLNGNFILAKNIDNRIFNFNGILEINNRTYVFGCLDSTNFGIGMIFKYDATYNFLGAFYYGIETFNPVLLNKNILFAAHAGYSQIGNVSDRNK